MRAFQRSNSFGESQTRSSKCIFFISYFILFYFFFVCVNKENDTDQRALASIKLLIVVQ